MGFRVSTLLKIVSLINRRAVSLTGQWTEKPPRPGLFQAVG
jgi:hypothetical protein